jgi:hypothetical protein
VTMAGVVIWLNMALATASAIVCAVAIRRGIATHRVHFAGVGALASFYVVGYIWLLFNPDRAQTWSEFYRGVALVTWVVVWIKPAVRSVLTQRDLSTKMDNLEEAVKESLK